MSFRKASFVLGTQERPHSDSTSTSVAVTMTSAGTNTALSASAASVMYGSTITFTASVSSASGIPAGRVTFYDGTALLGAVKEWATVSDFFLAGYDLQKQT